MMRSGLQENQPFLAGEYRLVRKLGVGGMSQVWEAVEVYSGNAVAIKILTDPGGGFAERFRNEHRFYTELRHPNIVRMLRAGVTPPGEGSVMFIVMERLEGITLREVIKRSRRADLLQALHIGVQLCDTMAYVHGKGIWHRDLKPENLLLGVEGEARGHLWLLDFGISKYADPAKDRSLKRTDDLPDVATCKYMSPEQVRDRGAVSAQSDIYAFGFIFYELVTRAHPFVPEGVPTAAGMIMQGHLTAHVVPAHHRAPELPEAVWRVIETCIQRDPARRYRSFEEVRGALGGLIEETRTAGHPLAKHLQDEALRAARAHAFEEPAASVEPPTLARAKPAGRGKGFTEKMVSADLMARAQPATRPPAPVDPLAETARASERTPGAALRPASGGSRARRSWKTWAVVGAAAAVAAAAVTAAVVLIPRWSDGADPTRAASTQSAPRPKAAGAPRASASTPPSASQPARKAPPPARPKLR